MSVANLEFDFKAVDSLKSQNIPCLSRFIEQVTGDFDSDYIIGIGLYRAGLIQSAAMG